MALASSENETKWYSLLHLKRGAPPSGCQLKQLHAEEDSTHCGQEAHGTAGGVYVLGAQAAPIGAAVCGSGRPGSES